jgi:hypothetical protein
MQDVREQAETLQNLLVAHATGGQGQNSADYLLLRKRFMTDRTLAPLLPGCVRTCTNLEQFWQYIKRSFKTYADRREYLWAEFRPLLEHLEREPSPADASVDDALKNFDAAHVYAAWSKALDRRDTDPEGAITAARTLLESVCKHILDDANISYDEGIELPKLYKLTAKQLRLAPEQHSEGVFKQILGGCASVVDGLGALRNRLSDAHGRGARTSKTSGTACRTRGQSGRSALHVPGFYRGYTQHRRTATSPWLTARQRIAGGRYRVPQCSCTFARIDSQVSRVCA